jgi:hypothetical protein
MTESMDSRKVKSMRKINLLLIMIIAALSGSCLSQGKERIDLGRPNIIIVMADDMGFSDLGSYGGEIKTPVIDRLANEGVRFSQFYNCAICGPSRASLMTGFVQQYV